MANVRDKMVAKSSHSWKQQQQQQQQQLMQNHLVAKKGKTAKPYDDRSDKEKEADWLMDRQIDIPLYTLLAILIAHALSGTSSLSLPQLSTHLPHSIQTLLPGWARHLPIFAPFATELPNASHDSKNTHGHSAEQFWTTSGYAGPFRSDAVGFGHPLTALHNFTRACLGLSYEVQSDDAAVLHSSATYLTGDLRYGRSYFDRYPWNSWVGPSSSQTGQNGILAFMNRSYSKGAKDVLFVFTGIFVFTVLRALVIRYALIPLGNLVISTPKPANDALSPRARAMKAAKMHRRTVNRFSEQAWIALWGTLSLCLSLFTASREPYWTSEMKLWTDYPFRHISGLTKFYYLLQTAFWVQQVMVINVEAPRKDHWQMLSHHVVTIALLLGSYTAHFTPIGNIVLILMDPCDILLSTAKCLKYYGAQVACDVCFGLFMLGWIVTRHVFYNRMLYSCIGVARYVLPERPGAMRHDYWGFRTPMALMLVALLCVLQVILCVWLVMIVRVAWRVVSGQGAADTRSDDDDDDHDDDKEEEEEAQDQEEGNQAEHQKKDDSRSCSSVQPHTLPDLRTTSASSATEGQILARQRLSGNKDPLLERK